MKCLVCSTQNSDNAKFCNHCGVKMEQYGKTCPNPTCKRSGLPDEAVFCPECGTLIEKKIAGASPESVLDGFNQTVQKNYLSKPMHYKEFHENKSIKYSYSYYDNLSIKGKTWSDYKNEHCNWKHENGLLKAYGIKPGVTARRFHPIERLRICSYFEVGIDVKKYSGPDNVGFGIYFASVISGSSNHFGINGYSQFYIGQLINNNWNGKFMIDKDKVINSEDWNNLKVIYDGKDFVYFINKWMVYKQSGDMFGDVIGIYLSSELKEVCFDNLTVDVVY